MYEAEHDRALYEEAFAAALSFAAEGLKAERALVTFSGNGRVHNLDPAQLWTVEPISLTLLRGLVDNPEPRVLADVIRKNQHVTSVTLSGLQSILFAPIRARTGEVCGCYYMDSRLKTRAFGEDDLKQVEAVVAGRLEPLLRQTGACRPLTWEVMLKTCWL